ncbi:hypothetical protein [Nocardia abscessus]|uniref:hypothetical protein n=1 Tax=Nocardia abscessus TaxID=120957 RepID=UPI0024573CDC|nr:hypothetical protein [Nocardia abscessus]
MQRSRERVRRRRELARERDRAIAAAVRRYLSDWQAITACETKRDAEIAELRRQISVVEDEAAAQIASLRADQGSAAMTIRDQPGHTDDDVADLLEITPKQVRQLITLARTQASDPPAPPEDAETADLTREQTQRTQEKQTYTDGTESPGATGVPAQTEQSR